MSARILRSLREIADGYRGILCDVWGVYHNGVAVYPEASGALHAFREAGGRVVMLTNAPRPASEVAEAMLRLGGREADYDSIVTSGDAAREFLATGEWGRRALHLGPARDLPLIRGLDIERVSLEAAEFVLCTGLFDDGAETPDDYRPLLADALARNLPMLCSNPDRFVDRGPLRVPCAGSIAAVYEALGGEVRWFGKPYPPVYETALARLDRAAGEPLAPEEVLAVGDGVLTDVAGAAAKGLDCLFVSGGLASREIRHRDGSPDDEDLDRFLRRHDRKPIATIGQLR